MGVRVAGLCAVALVGCRFGFEDRTNDARGVDTAMPDIADAPPVTGCPSFALFCEDFELGDLRRWTSTDLMGPATAIVSAARVRTGDLALEATVEPAASDGGNAAPLFRFPDQTTGVLAVRQWINLVDPLRQFNLVLEVRHVQSEDYVTAGGNGLANWVSTEEDGTTAVDHDSTTPTPALDTWTCVELVYSFPGPDPARVQLYVDDAPVLDVPSVYTAPAFNEVRIGITRADLTGFSVFTDDVVIANQRIGCQ